MNQFSGDMNCFKCPRTYLREKGVELFQIFFDYKKSGQFLKVRLTYREVSAAVAVEAGLVVKSSTAKR